MPKVVLVGDSGSGKTSLFNQFVYGNHAVNWPSTSAILIKTKTVNVNGRDVSLTVLDLPGHDGFIRSLSNYTKNANVVVINIDLNATIASADPVKDIVQQIKDWKNKCSNVSNNAVFIVTLNKADLVDAQIPLEQIQAEANKLGIQSVSVSSAKENEGVTDLFSKFVEITPANEQTFQSELAINVPGFSDATVPDEDEKELAAARRRKFLIGAGKFLLGLLIIGAIVGLVMLFVFPPAGLATLLATTVAGSLTVGSVAGIAAATLGVLAVMGTTAYSLFKRRKTNSIKESSSWLDLEISSRSETTSASEKNARDAIGSSYSETPAQSHLLGRASSDSTTTGAPPAPGSDQQLRK